MRVTWLATLPLRNPQIWLLCSLVQCSTISFQCTFLHRIYLNIVPWWRYLLRNDGLSHLISQAFIPRPPSVLQSLCYKQFSHTNCVDYRTLACHADSRTVPYSWRFWLSTYLLCSEAGCRLPALFLTRILCSFQTLNFSFQLFDTYRILRHCASSVLLTLPLDSWLLTLDASSWLFLPPNFLP
jgi:hypothetical protein